MYSEHTICPHRFLEALTSFYRSVATSKISSPWLSSSEVGHELVFNERRPPLCAWQQHRMQHQSTRRCSGREELKAGSSSVLLISLQWPLSGVISCHPRSLWERISAGCLQMSLIGIFRARIEYSIPSVMMMLGP